MSKPVLSPVLTVSKREELSVIYGISEVIPGFCCITAQHIWESIFQSLDKSHYWLRGMSLVGILRFPFFLGMVHSFWLEFPPAEDQRMVFVTICTLVAVSELDTMLASSSCDDYVQLMPMLGPQAPPRDSVLWLCCKIAVCNAQDIETGECEEVLSILIHSSNSIITKAGRPEP